MSFLRLAAISILLCFSGALQAIEPEPYFKQSFLDLQEDLEEATDNGRTLMLLFEQDGCPYCGKLHETTFKDPEIIKILSTQFDVIQLDIWGKRDVVGLDGEEMPEKNLARDLGIQFSPLIVFIGEDGKEKFRMPGYYKPALFRLALDYVSSKSYDSIAFREYATQKIKLASKGLQDKSFFLSGDSLKQLKTDAARQNKSLAILFEQEKCEDCAELHETSFSDAETLAKLNGHFQVKQLNAYGNKALTDLDGSPTTEAKLAEKYKITYTPTIVFLNQDGDEIKRYDSYLIPEHFSTLMTYITTDAMQRHASFQDWLREKNAQAAAEAAAARSKTSTN